MKTNRHSVNFDSIKQIKDDMNAEGERTGYGVTLTWHVAAFEFLKRHKLMSPTLAAKYKAFFKTLK